MKQCISTLPHIHTQASREGNESYWNPLQNPLEYKQFNLLSPKQHRPTTTTDTSQNTLTQNCQAYLNVTTKRFYETMPACGLIFAKLKPQSATAIQK